MVIELETTFENQKNQILEIINKYVNQENIHVSDTTIENLAIHLSLNVSRELNGSYIPTSISQLKQLKKHEYYNVSKSIISEIAEIFGIKIHKSEIYYITMYLSQMNLFDYDFNCEFDIFDDVIENVIDETIMKIKEELGIDLKANDNFYKGITLHFFPAIERLQNDDQLDDNPLVESIKNEHEIEFKCANILNEVVMKYYSKSFNKHELAYIALHFGTAL